MFNVRVMSTQYISAMIYQLWSCKASIPVQYYNSTIILHTEMTSQINQFTTSK
jgi:hypothetical protein